jgi:asparagine synthase (glutamine-hydrolysing)
MTGVVGFTFSGDQATADVELSAMLAAVQDHASYQVDRWIGDGVALGRVSLGRIDKQLQPIWNEDQTQCIIFEGELFDSASLRAELEAAGHGFSIGNAAELVLHLWEEYSTEGIKLLNGHFTFAIWNSKDRSLAVGNDRFGFRHVYYATVGDQLLFAGGVRGLLANSRLPRKVDGVGISQFLHFEHLLGDRTFVESVKLLPPATVLQARGGFCARHHYWHWSLPEYYQPRSYAEYRDSLLQLIKQAVARQLPTDDVRGGVNLSGGLDSRMLLGALATETDMHNLRTFSFGIRGCDDVALGRKVARLVGAQHEALPLPSDYLLSYAELGVRLTDGMDSCIHIHTLANINAQASQVDFLYTGYYMDSIANSHSMREWLVPFDDDTSLRLHYDYMHRVFPHDSDSDIFAPEFLAATREQFGAAFREAVTELKSDTMATWLQSVDIVHRQRRLIQFGNDLVRWQLECRTPYTDGDVVDFCLALPHSLRLDRVLFIDTLIAHFPKLAKVPSDRTGMPYLVDVRYLSRQARLNLHYLLHQRGLLGEPRHQHKLYARYDLWFRSALREWVEQILLDRQTLQRNIMQPAALQRIVQEHMTGAVDRTRELGALLSVELWHRAYVD